MRECFPKKGVNDLVTLREQVHLRVTDSESYTAVHSVDVVELEIG